MVERLKPIVGNKKNAWEFQPEFVVVRNKYLAMETAIRKSKTLFFQIQLQTNHWAEFNGFFYSVRLLSVFPRCHVSSPLRMRLDITVV